jgi:hypothetical protein
MVQRTAAGLREVLFQQIEGVKNGSIVASDAKAIAAVAGTILKSVEVEMAFREQQRALADSGEVLGDLELSNLPAPEPVAALPGPRVIKGRADSGSR